MRHALGVSPFCLGILLATDAMAGCPQGQEAFTSCRFDDRGTEVFVCFDDQVATYSYGPIGGPPDLFLSETIERVDFEPWSGVGTAIGESVTFYNHDYAYNVGGGFERPFSEEEMQLPQRRFGWVEVTESGVPAARFECTPETVTYGFGGGLYDAKVAAGQSWDWDSKTWISEHSTSVATPILMETRQYGADFDCLPASEFGMNGVRMGDPLAALGKLGTPEATEETSFSDEPIDRMTLIGANIDFFQDVVVTISASSPNWQLPSGLRVGLTRGEVIRILGRVPASYTAQSQSFAIQTCPQGQGAEEQVPFGKWFALIEFGQDKRVSRLTLLTPPE
ncbi:hypothetical protein [Aliiroseovarius crassostreae]|uniref:hypothetical protein n=1 Tax=Aliiroseovarius crassostreae TaxID=154981 RepID=UPI00220FDBAE|nr:hypothetical protein [Aliiroseovarius crassostreae]UWQ07076.1 hypothetical protein K3X25_09740 [Aliiroseovarius crassostreae]